MAVEDRTLPIADVSDQLRRWGPRLFGIGFTYVLWVGIATVFPNDLMPYPVPTLRVALELYLSGAAIEHLSITLARIAAGFVGAMLIGGTAGVLMGTTSFGEKFLSPFVVMGLAFPSVALAAICALIWGFTFTAPVVAATLAVAPFVAVNVWKGVENLDHELLEMASSFDVSNRRLLTRVVVPDAAPSLFAATRFGLALSWKVVTVAEVFASSSGVGYKVIQTYSQFQFTETWAWAVVFMAVVVVLEYLVFKPLERRAFAHRPDADFELVGAN